LQDSPPPRFDLLKLEKYTTVTLQFSRGCPFRCDFCDIIVMFGRKPRHKSLQQLGRELDELRWRNIRNVFFVDDNLIGHKAVAKTLLHFLRQYQEQYHYHFRFGTQTSLNLAQEPELLQLFRAANFSWVFIGIESPDAATLKATRKVQNTHEDPLTAVRKIYAYGIDVLAGFIVGFDNDTPATFEQQYQFILDSGIQIAMIGLLMALPRTPLYERLQAEGRLLPEMDNTDNTKPGTNFIPKGMRYDVMVDAYKTLYQRLVSDRDIANRIRNKTRYLVHPIYQGEYSFEEKKMEYYRPVPGQGFAAGRSIPVVSFSPHASLALAGTDADGDPRLDQWADPARLCETTLRQSSWESRYDGEKTQPYPPGCRRPLCTRRQGHCGVETGCRCGSKPLHSVQRICRSRFFCTGHEASRKVSPADVVHYYLVDRRIPGRGDTRSGWPIATVSAVWRQNFYWRGQKIKKYRSNRLIRL